MALDNAITADRLSEYMLLYKDVMAKYLRAENKCNEMQRSQSLEIEKLLEEVNRLQTSNESYKSEERRLKEEIERINVRTLSILMDKFIRTLYRTPGRLLQRLEPKAMSLSRKTIRQLTWSSRNILSL